MAFDERLSARLAEEDALLRKAFPAARIDQEALVVILCDHPLPPGWSHDKTDILFAIPANYPAGQPDNVCARPDLTLAGGASPGNNQGQQTYAARSWLQFSYHVEPADWRPTVDASVGSNLVEYLTGALTRFEEPS